MDNYKKSTVKEQENNEKLTLLLNKVMADIMHVQSQIERSMAKREALKMDYMTYTRTLQETEQALAKVTTVSMPLSFRQWLVGNGDVFLLVLLHYLRTVPLSGTSWGLYRHRLKERHWRSVGWRMQ